MALLVQQRRGATERENVAAYLDEASDRLGREADRLGQAADINERADRVPGWRAMMMAPSVGKARSMSSSSGALKSRARPLGKFGSIVRGSMTLITPPISRTADARTQRAHATRGADNDVMALAPAARGSRAQAASRRGQQRVARPEGRRGRPGRAGGARASRAGVWRRSGPGGRGGA